jgi:WD40 repeat protein
MKRVGYLLLLAGFAALPVSPLKAEEPPRYHRDIKPFFARYCIECHNADKLKGGLNLESYQSLGEGDENGPVLVPGKPDRSRIVLVVEGKSAPAMPPLKARQPKPHEKTLLRAWVASGAREDAVANAGLPDIKPRVAMSEPVPALAYRPDGKALAAAAGAEVIFINAAGGESAGTLIAETAPVTALAFSSDGKALAVASGASGRPAELALYSVSLSPPHAVTPLRRIRAHRDVIFSVAFSPDGKNIATCSYDRLVKLWDAASGKERHGLKDHSDAVYAVAFSPDGKLMASASADRAVKVWDVASGKRLYTLGDSTDWLYALAWSPDGHRLAAGGVDRTIRVWEVSRSEGRLAQSTFAHEGPITRLAYGKDGLLYSLSEDRIAKAWDAAQLVERRVYPRQSDTPLALAVRPDGRQLAIGRYDGVVVLTDTVSGRVESQPLPVKKKPPHLVKVSPDSITRGKQERLVFEGDHLQDADKVIVEYPGVTARLLPTVGSKRRREATVTFPATTPAGTYQVGLRAPSGESARLTLVVDAFESVPEIEPNNSPASPQQVTLPVSILGALDRPGDVDWYRFKAHVGREVGVQVITTPSGDAFEPVLTLTDAAGQLLAEKVGSHLGHICERDGEYALGLRDRRYRGGPAMHYRLQVGNLPVVRSVFPLGLQRGTRADFVVDGVNLGGPRRVPISAPANAEAGRRLPILIDTPLGKPLGQPEVVVGEFPEVIASQGSVWLPVPGTANGRIVRPGQADSWHFHAVRGERLIVEVNARRLGSPLDSALEVLDAHGRPLPRALLRSLAKIYTTFRDHDSATAGVRLESWNELAVNDYLYGGGELMRIQALPKSPDDDCQLFSVPGQRLAFLDTTPTYHSLGTPLYKVSIQPPNAHLPPNGLPVFPVFYQNDDGGPGYGKDSRLFFEPPADGEYQVRVTDAREQGGSDYAYRVTIRPPRPAFRVHVNLPGTGIWSGGAIPIAVSTERIDGFAGSIDITPQTLVPGFAAPATTIPAEESSTAFALSADAAAGAATKLDFTASASIDGRTAVQHVSAGVVKAVPPGSLQVFVERPTVDICSGGRTRVVARIERRAGFKGRVPLDVRGLPHGIRVLDIGLNGILITESQTSRAFVLAAEPWVKPMNHPIVVVARDEAKGAEYAARSVMLRVAAGEPSRK